jgi:hypothetical protein
MIPEQLDSQLDSYGWLEHMLMWRLDSLHLARAHAVQYLQEITELLSPSSEKHIRSVIESYCELLGMLVSDNISSFTPIHIPQQFRCIAYAPWGFAQPATRGRKL